MYIRGKAYLAAGRGREAAAEFQKILNHRGIVLADPIGALAYLQLGRAYVVSADKIKAKNAYKNFLTLWKQADSDIQSSNRPPQSTGSYKHFASSPVRFAPDRALVAEHEISD